MPTVMPWPKRVTSCGARPAASSVASTAATTASLWSAGVVGTLAVTRRPALTSTASVKVPPTSTPTRCSAPIIAPTLMNPARRTAIALALAAAAPAASAAAPAPVLAPGGDLRASPAELLPGPPNGDLSAGLAGWVVEGHDPPALLAPGARLAGNTTLVSPPLAIPAGAQTLRVALRAPGGGGLALVRARPDDGGPEVDLATLEPGAARRSWPVGVGALAGRTVRIVLDPVPALGTALDVLRVGPVTAPLPGWSVTAGAPDVTGARGRRVLSVAGTALAVRSPAYAVPAGPRRRTLGVDVRGDGTVRIAAGGRSVTRRATPAWRTVRLTLPGRGRTRIALGVVATPGAGGLQLRALGAVVRARPVRNPGR